MDNFTLAVLVGDAVVVISLIALMIFDKPKPLTAPVEPPRPSGKKSA